MKRKDHMILFDAEKAIDKIHHPFMMKTLKTLGIEGNYLNRIKAICEKLTVNIKLNGERLIAFPLKIRNKARMPTFIISI